MKKAYILFSVLAFSLMIPAYGAAGRSLLYQRDSVTLSPDSLSIRRDSLERQTDSTLMIKADLPDSTLLDLKTGMEESGLDTLSVEYEVNALTDEYLDSLDINKKLLINDYSMIGITYGGAFNSMNFNPVKKSSFFYTPHQIGITYTKYCKMFGYMPYFGLQLGLLYGQDGYQFKADSEGKISHVDGATRATYEYIEVPALAHLHIDVWRLKFMVNLGLYGGYRLSVKREGQLVPEEYLTHFYDYENRLDYGFKGGLGIGFIFTPCELHINALFRHSLSSIYKPDYSSAYFYKYAYPMSLSLTVGLHFHLGRRTGKTHAQLRQEAYDRVFNPSTEENKK